MLCVRFYGLFMCTHLFGRVESPDRSSLIADSLDVYVRLSDPTPNDNAIDWLFLFLRFVFVYEMECHWLFVFGNSANH